MAAWKIVALTLGAVLAAGLIFIAGLVVGIAMSEVAQSGALGQSTSGGSSPNTAGSNDGAATGGSGAEQGSTAIDQCLVGTWRTTEYEQRTTSPQGEVVLTGLERTFTFDENGRHVVTYDKDEATMSVNGEPATVIFDGTVTYQVSISGSTMSFRVESSEGTMTIVNDNGDDEVRDLQPGTGSVTFTCAGDTYTEQDDIGFREVATRVG